MPFYYVPIDGKQFGSIVEVESWVAKEGKLLDRIPVLELLEHGARFVDDEYLAVEDQFLKFNQHGIRAFLQPLGLRFETLNMVEQPGLISHLLNDLITQRDIQNRLENCHFVVDNSSDTVLGIVSESYITYSNIDFLQDIKQLLGERQQVFFPDLSDAMGRFRFVNGFSVNTQTYLRFTITVRAGLVTSHYGESEDVSEIGVQFKNSMVGDAAVSIEYFVNRLICTNGMIVPAGAAYNRIFHSGKRENFLDRLAKCFREVERKIGEAGQSIRTLMEIDFDPEALARVNMVEAIFDIIPDSRSKVMEDHGIKRRAKAKMTESERILYEAEIIGGIPDSYAGEFSSRVFNTSRRDKATMFDLINIFTEYAQTLPIHSRLETEEKAGLLADQIVKNKKKFKAAQPDRQDIGKDG